MRARLGREVSIASAGKAERPARNTVKPSPWMLKRIESTRRVLDVGAVLQHLHLFERDEAAAHHRVERRQERLDRLLVIDNLDDERQVLGEAQDLRRVQAARLAETHRSAQDRGAGEAGASRGHDDRLIERAALKLVVLAEEDAQ